MNDGKSILVFHHLLQVMILEGGTFVVLGAEGQIGLESISWSTVPTLVASDAIAWATENFALAAQNGPQTTKMPGWNVMIIAQFDRKLCFLSVIPEDSALQREAVSLEVRDLMNTVGKPEVKWIDTQHANWIFETDDSVEQQLLFKRWCGWFGFDEDDRPEKVERDTWYMRRH
jgi:hypothetical protein